MNTNAVKPHLTVHWTACWLHNPLKKLHVAVLQRLYLPLLSCDFPVLFCLFCFYTKKHWASFHWPGKSTRCGKFTQFELSKLPSLPRRSTLSRLVHHSLKTSLNELLARSVRYGNCTGNRGYHIYSSWPFWS